MLRSLKELEKYTVTATDGDVGKVVNFLFDDERWALRHLVVQTGGFFNERYVLISPISFREIDWAAQSFHVALTKDKIKNAPGIDTDRPVSRQREQDYYRYYGYSQYWGYMGPWGSGCYPALLRSGPASSTLNDQAGSVLSCAERVGPTKRADSDCDTVARIGLAYPATVANPARSGSRGVDAGSSAHFTGTAQARMM
jgi:hypothetical protein